MSNDWDLSAIVRSCSSSSASHKAIARNKLEESFCSPDEFPFHFSPPFLDHFPVLIPQRIALNDPFDELSRVYKPFYPRVQQPFTAVTAATIPVAAADSVIRGSENKRRRPGKEVQQPTNAAAPIADAAILINAAENQNGGVRIVRSHAQALRGRKRKQPRLVMKKNEESLSEDEWNWRKYGQKPIFGSMNPRSYYRCTSFKGCAARKQVEQCEDEPGMFIVTYVGDHTHCGGGGGGSASPTSDDTPKPSDEASKQEYDDDIVMAMHALGSIGSEHSGGQPPSPPKSVGTAGDLLRSPANVRESH